MTAAEFCDLVAGMDPAWICNYLRINPRTLKRWKEGTAAVPYAAVLALKVKLNGDVASFAGKGWEGFFFARDGKFWIPFFHRGFDPLQICGMFFEVQELRHMRREVKRLKAELWAQKKVRQLTQEQQQ